ncbi:hypothetical protein IW261DRAFT_298364 [Armillaria novae-zelandiae]|uniref:Uncharacterized protein n=1 Tax=Armillaria novae-zelandiae TaxID=153914 RepID=A0AA39P4W7_9AGAR|nr:hypothetical protein IW261DRAFT_298364 [Armillaria novae-zelandiae]
MYLPPFTAVLLVLEILIRTHRFDMILKTLANCLLTYTPPFLHRGCSTATTNRHLHLDSSTPGPCHITNLILWAPSITMPGIPIRKSSDRPHPQLISLFCFVVSRIYEWFNEHLDEAVTQTWHEFLPPSNLLLSIYVPWHPAGIPLRLIDRLEDLPRRLVPLHLTPPHHVLRTQPRRDTHSCPLPGCTERFTGTAFGKPFFKFHPELNMKSKEGNGNV